MPDPTPDTTPDTTLDTTLHDTAQQAHQAHQQALEKQHNELTQWRVRLSRACRRDPPQPPTDHKTYAAERLRRIWDNERTLAMRTAEIKELFAHVDAEMRMRRPEPESPALQRICWGRLTGANVSAARARDMVDGLVWKKRKSGSAARGGGGGGGLETDENVLKRVQGGLDSHEAL